MPQWKLSKWKRNNTILDKYCSGSKIKELCEEFNLSQTRIRQIIWLQESYREHNVSEPYKPELNYKQSYLLKKIRNKIINLNKYLEEFATEGKILKIHCLEINEFGKKTYFRIDEEIMKE